MTEIKALIKKLDKLKDLADKKAGKSTELKTLKIALVQAYPDLRSTFKKMVNLLEEVNSDGYVSFSMSDKIEALLGKLTDDRNQSM